MSDTPLKVLFLAPRPADLGPLAVKDELRRIVFRLRNLGDQIRVVEKWAVAFADLTEHLLDEQPQIVHLSGHGAAAGDEQWLCFEDDMGRKEYVRREVAAALFAAGVVKRCVRLALFNACYQEALARDVTGSIDFAIGVRSVITDKAASAFAEAFYRAIGSGETVQDSFDVALVQYKQAMQPGAALPVLFVRDGADPHVSLRGGKSAGAPDSMNRPPANRIPRIFLHYVRADERFAGELLKWLRPLAARKLIEVWDEQHDILPGHLRNVEIDGALERSQLFVPLVSAAASADTDWQEITARALARRNMGAVLVAPILLSPTLLAFGPFPPDMTILPAVDRPISAASDRDAAWQYVVEQLLRLPGIGPAK